MRIASWDDVGVGSLANGNASVAQGIEHRSPKAGVVRSNRIGGTIKLAGQMGNCSSGLLLFRGEAACCQRLVGTVSHSQATSALRSIGPMSISCATERDGAPVSVPCGCRAGAEFDARKKVRCTCEPYSG